MRPRTLDHRWLVLAFRTGQAGNRAPPEGRIHMGSGNRLVDPNSGMQVHAHYHWERRDFVKGVAALPAAAGLSAYDMRSAAAEPPPEIKKIRLVRTIAVCLAPQYLAEE